MVLTAASIVPLVALAAIAVLRLATMERESTRNEMLRTAHAIAAVVDMELARAREVLEQLAEAAPSSDQGIPAFYDQCVTTMIRRGAAIALLRPTGEIVFDTTPGLGTAPPTYEDGSGLADFLAGRHHFSNLFYRGPERRPQFAIYVPVGGVHRRAVLAMIFPAAALAKLLAQQEVPEGQYLSLLDRNRVFLARHANAASVVGTRLPADSPAPGPGAGGGFYSFASPALHMPVHLATVTAKETGWEVALVVPRALADAPLRQSLATILGIGAAMLLLGLGVAFVIGRRLSRDMRALADAAEGLVRLDPVPAIASPARDIGEVAEALGVASAALRDSRQQLQRSREHLARAQTAAGIGSFEHDLAAAESHWSPETYVILGHSPDGFVPSPTAFLACVAAADRPLVARMVADLREGRLPPGLEVTIIRPDGEARDVRIESEPVLVADDRVVGYLGVIQDITERRRLEAERRGLEDQLHHSQKLEALGTLAGGIAHDLNNTLVPVLALTSLVRRKLPEGSLQRQQLDMVHDAGSRARNLVSQILAFSRKEKAAKAAIDLAEVAREALDMLRATIPANIHIERRIAATAPLLGDATQLNQVIVNLVANAAQAIGDGTGEIVVTVERSAAASDGGAPFVLSVADSGCGMSEETRRRVFEPFFTTKPVGEGTGLGLSVVHGIVTNHGGTIEVTSAPGQGTTFTVTVPTADMQETAEDPALARGAA